MTEEMIRPDVAVDLASVEQVKTEDLLSLVDSRAKKGKKKIEVTKEQLDVKPIKKVPEERKESEFKVEETKTFIKESPIPHKEESKPVIEEKKVDKEDNIKNLKEIIQIEKREKEDFQSKFENQKNKLAELEARNKTLEAYEYMYALESNPVFKEKYVDSVNNLILEAKKIATDYEVDPDVIDLLSETTSQKELNNTLRDNINDEDAISDLKNIFRQVQNIRKESSEYKNNAKSSLAKMKEEQSKQEVQRKEFRTKKLADVKNQGWFNAIKETREDKDVPYEILEIPGNQQHNNNIVKPLLQTATQVYEKVVSHIEDLISNQGEITPEFSKFLANQILHANASKMINHSRAYILNEYEKLKKNTQTERSYARPDFTSPPRSLSNGEDKSKSMKGLTAKERARKIALEIGREVLGDN